MESQFAYGTIGICAAVKRAVILFAVAVVFVLGFWFLRRSGKVSPHLQGAEATQPTTTSVTAPLPPTQTRLLGETILRGYANTNLPPEIDLTLMSRLMENSLLLLKSAAHRPLSANEDWAALLRGQNAAHERFLPERHAALDSQGRLVDRWGTALFFHALGGGRYEIRSAGPDGKLWTSDDIHRNSDGSFRRGPELNSPSLLEAATRGRPPSTAP